MTKVQTIWQYINFNHPTRKQLNCFILGIKEKHYEDKHRGHYGTNIAEWKRKGHVVVIDKKYTITPESLKDGLGRMYIALPSVLLAREIRLDLIGKFHERENKYRLDIRQLKDYVSELEYKLSKINSISTL